jgi:fused signal recognition particle receptor
VKKSDVNTRLENNIRIIKNIFGNTKSISDDLILSIAKTATEQSLSINKKFILSYIKTLITDRIKPIEIDEINPPDIIIMCGINGSGKTTLVRKIYKILKDMTWDATIACCDTSRVTSVDEVIKDLDIDESHYEFSYGSNQDDIIQKAYNKTIANKSNVMLVDTFGATCNNVENLTEIKSIISSISSVSKNKNHKVILVVDANSGLQSIKYINMMMRIIRLKNIYISKIDIQQNYGLALSILHHIKDIEINGLSSIESGVIIPDTKFFKDFFVLD